MVVFIKILQVILALSILIVLHEFGHFIFAKLFGIRVDKFFLFFDVGGTKLFSSKGKWFTKLFPKAKEAQTEYGIGWLPLGSYCKINGMIDESWTWNDAAGAETVGVRTSPPGGGCWFGRVCSSTFCSPFWSTSSSWRLGIFFHRNEKRHLHERTREEMGFRTW